MMIVHGTSDNFVRFNPTNGFHAPTSSAVAFWSQNAMCPDGAGQELPDNDAGDGSTIHLTSFGPCSDHTEVLLYRVDGGGHTWPGGGTQNGLGNTNRDVHASELALDFFKRNPMPNSPTSAVLDLPDDTGFRIEAYPNPSRETLQLSLQIDRASLLSIEALNQLGQVVHRQELVAPRGESIIRLALGLETAPAGVFVLRVHDQWGRTASTTLVRLASFR